MDCPFVVERGPRRFACGGAEPRSGGVLLKGRGPRFAQQNGVTNDPNTPSPPPAAPPAPVASTPTAPARQFPPPSTLTGPPVSRNPDILRSRFAPAALLLFFILVWTFMIPHQNKDEKLAARVTNAIIADNMKPVENDFNSLRWAELENRAKVGQLSQDLNELGKLKSVKEDTPKDSRPSYHHFQAQFEKGTWEEEMTYDPQGKIGSFYVHAPGARAR